MACLSTSNLHKSFGANHAVNGVSFELEPGTINLLMGSNGSGKTTLINCISGFFHPDDGSVFFYNSDITNNNPAQNFKNKIVRTFQTPKLFENLSVLENLLITNSNIGESFRYSLFYNKWKRLESSTTNKALLVLDSVNLRHLKNNLAYDLSGGQIKLLEIAKVLMLNPKIVLLDEPIAGIHPDLANKIFKKIVEICKMYNTTFLVIEHRLDIALKYVDYCFVLSAGQLIAKDTPDKILQNNKVIQSYLR